MVYPAYPAMVPGIAFFDGKNNYLEWDGNRLVDAVTGKPASALQVKPGGTLKGNSKWDTVHRSEHVVFRASQQIQDPKQYKTYNSDTDWPEVDTVPDYAGKADKISVEDQGCCR
jgi:hypothetical protein